MTEDEPPEGRPVGEGHGALAAPVRPVSRVSAQVQVPAAGLPEVHGAAQVAPERLLPGVGALVRHHVAALREGPEAVGAALGGTRRSGSKSGLGIPGSLSWSGGCTLRRDATSVSTRCSPIHLDLT